MTRIQTAESFHTPEEGQAIMDETGNPYPYYKNGTLFESTDGGVTGWYEHRGTILWTDNDIVVITH